MQAHGRTLAELQHSVKWNGLSSPCVTGLRSVCWKVSLSLQLLALATPDCIYMAIMAQHG